MIPEENDSFEEIERMCDWIVTNLGDSVPIHFTAFHPDYRVKHRPATPHQTLIRAREQAIKAGIKFAYVGNVNDVERQSTYCPNCSKMLIERDWYELGRYDIKDGCCKHCKTSIAGVFEKNKGSWGRKRMPVIIENDSAKPRYPGLL